MKHLSCLIFLLLAQFFVHNAQAETLPQVVGKLELLPLKYGANNIKINHKNITIIKGRIVTGTASEHDHYIVLEQQKNIWQIVRNEKKLNDDVIARAVPHTGEDSVVSIYFMAPKNFSDLYLLKVSRKYKENPSEPVQAGFSLSRLSRDADDLGVIYFNEAQATTSKAKYCNADSAAYHELKIPLPEGGEESKCLNK